MALASERRIASAPARRQGFARDARQLTLPLTATGASAQTVVRQLLTQLLRSSTTGSNTKFLTTPADKGYDRKELVRELRAQQVTPHFACKPYSAIDRRTTRHPGYAISQVKRKRVEEIFGWLKTVAGLRKTRHRGADRVGWMFTFAAAAYNLVRMRTLLPIAS